MIVPPGWSWPDRFGGLNHVERHAVLDGAAGILRFQFEKQRAGAGIEALQLQHGSVAN